MSNGRKKLSVIQFQYEFIVFTDFFEFSKNDESILNLFYFVDNLQYTLRNSVN